MIEFPEHVLHLAVGAVIQGGQDIEREQQCAVNTETDDFPRVAQTRRPTEEQVSALTDQIFEAIRAMLPSRYMAPYTETDGSDNPRE